MSEDWRQIKKFLEQVQADEIKQKIFDEMSPTLNEVMKFQNDFDDLASSNVTTNEPFPIAPLLRMARILGIERLRSILRDMSKEGVSEYRIVVQKRLQSEYPSKEVKQQKVIAADLKAERFGLAVLRLEASGMKRGEALQQAATQLKIPSGERDLKRKFARFAELSRRHGIFDNRALIGLRPSIPRYKLSQLINKGGRPKKR